MHLLTKLNSFFHLPAVDRFFRPYRQQNFFTNKRMCVPLSLTVSPAGGKPGVCCRRPRSICTPSVVLLRYPVIWQAGKPALRRSAVCRPYSFIRSPFVDGPPPDRLKSRPATYLYRPSSTVHRLSCGLRSAVHIRLFVPHSLTVLLTGSQGLFLPDGMSLMQYALLQGNG